MKSARGLPKTLLLAATLTFLTVAYFILFHTFAHSSDDANPLLSAYEMTHGNPILKGWAEPASTFYGVDLLLIGALTLLLGKSPIILVLAPALVWALTVLGSALVAAKCCAPDRTVSAVACVFLILGLPPIFANETIGIITVAPVHITSIFYALGLCVLCAKYLSSLQCERWVLPAFVVVLTLLTMGDPFSPYFCAAPICLTCLSLRASPRHSAYKLLVATLLSVATGKTLLCAIDSAGGFTVSQLPAAFVAFDNLGSNISLIVQGLLSLFGANFFGLGISTGANGPIVALARLPIVLILCVSIWHLWRKVCAETLTGKVAVDPIRVVLLWSVAVVLAANLFSTLPVNLMTSRYLLPVLVFGAILVGIELPNVLVARWWIAGALCVSFVSLAYGYAASPDKHRFADDNQQQLVAWLRANDLSDGYGPYWSAGIITAISGGKTTVSAAAPGPDGKLAPFVWISPRDPWYQEHHVVRRRQFVVVENRTIEPKFTQQQVIATFGQPARIETVGPYTVNVYAPLCLAHPASAGDEDETQRTKDVNLYRAR